ncbi:MAG: hypothetical protein NZL87_05845, partial [Thermomicrobium sp.]|nr:hypothetical protein [Thermomicrobium sp.]
ESHVQRDPILFHRGGDYRGPIVYAEHGGRTHDGGAMNVTCIGIDPGLSGAIAALTVVDGVVTRAVVYDMPVVVTRRSDRTIWREHDIRRFDEIISEIRGIRAYCGIERQNARPDDGVVSAFRVGESYGVALTVMTMHRIPTIMVAPSTWKLRYGLIRQGKQAARIEGMRRFPDVDLTRKRHDGRADALWIAQYVVDTMVLGEGRKGNAGVRVDAEGKAAEGT